MSIKDDIEGVELSIEQAKAMIKKGEIALRLSKNKDFRELIMDDYFVDEAARLTHLFSDPSMQDDAKQAMIQNDLRGIGGLKRYLQVTIRMKQMAEDSLPNHEETLDELRLEESEG